MIQLNSIIVSKGLKMEKNIKKWVWQHENPIFLIEGSSGRNVRYEVNV